MTEKISTRHVLRIPITEVDLTVSGLSSKLDSLSGITLKERICIEEYLVLVKYVTREAFPVEKNYDPTGYDSVLEGSIVAKFIQKIEAFKEENPRLEFVFQICDALGRGEQGYDTR